MDIETRDKMNKNEKAILSIEAYLHDLDPQFILDRTDPIPWDQIPQIIFRIENLEKTIPVYTAAQELMTDLHAAEIVSSQDYYHEINAIKTDVKEINNKIDNLHKAFLIVIDKLNKQNKS